MHRPRPCIGVAGTHCLQLTTNRRGRCDHCQRQADRQRGTSTERGYDAAHRRLREQLDPIVAAGQAVCRRCGNQIKPGQPWDLGHHADRTRPPSPEHRICNRQTAAHKAQSQKQEQRPAALAFFDTTPVNRDPLPRRQIPHTRRRP